MLPVTVQGMVQIERSLGHKRQAEEAMLMSMICAASGGQADVYSLCCCLR